MASVQTVHFLSDLSIQAPNTEHHHNYNAGLALGPMHIPLT